MLDLINIYLRKKFSRYRPKIYVGTGQFCEIGVIPDYRWSGPHDLNYCDHLLPDVLQWLIDNFGQEGERWWLDKEMLIVPHPRGGKVYSGHDMIKYLEFLNDEDLVLFKLTWAGE